MYQSLGHQKFMRNTQACLPSLVVILQAISSYLMSIYKVPQSLCQDLLSIMSQFWWGSIKGKRKIAWVKWDRICRPKCIGGLGFHDLELFNQALVAKQAWPMICNANSLSAKILKRKYFHDYDFLLSEDKNGSSYLWKSLLWGHDVIIKGTCWKVGCGETIRVFDDPWLPRPGAFKPLSHLSLRVTLVKDLLLYPGC